MLRTSSEVNWAEELGIEVPRLWSEHPGHPFQLQNKKLMLQKSEHYWRVKAVESLWADDEQV